MSGDLELAVELRACPFCGATPHRGLSKTERCQMRGEPLQRYSIWCPHGHATINAISEGAAITEWSFRVPEAAATRLEGQQNTVLDDAALAQTLFLNDRFGDGSDLLELEPDYAAEIARLRRNCWEVLPEADQEIETECCSKHLSGKDHYRKLARACIRALKSTPATKPLEEEPSE